MFAMLCHLSALAGFIIPFGNVIGPLVVWMMKKDQSSLVEDQGKESVNFQITVAIVALIASPLLCVGIGIFVLPAIGLIGCVMAVLGGIKANAGERYRYPFAIRLVK